MVSNMDDVPELCVPVIVGLVLVLPFLLMFCSPDSVMVSNVTAYSEPDDVPILSIPVAVE